MIVGGWEVGISLNARSMGNFIFAIMEIIQKPLDRDFVNAESLVALCDDI